MCVCVCVSVRRSVTSSICSHFIVFLLSQAWLVCPCVRAVWSHVLVRVRVCLRAPPCSYNFMHISSFCICRSGQHEHRARSHAGSIGLAACALYTATHIPASMVTARPDMRPAAVVGDRNRSVNQPLSWQHLFAAHLPARRPRFHAHLVWRRSDNLC